MRPNVARRRITFNEEAYRPERRSYFYLAPTPLLGGWDLMSCIAVCLGQWVLAALLILVSALLPVDADVFERVYLPALILMMAVPWGARLMDLPPGVVALQSFLLLVATGARMLPALLDSEYGVAWGALVIMSGPLIAQLYALLLAAADPHRSSRWVIAAAILVLGARAMSLADGPPCEAPPMQWTLLAMLCGVSVILIRAYAGRIAASWRTSVVGSIRLVDLSCGLYERAHGSLRVSHAGWRACAAASAMGVAGTADLLTDWSCGGERWRELEWGYQLAWPGSIAAATLLMCVRLRCGPLTYLRRVVTGLAVTAILWQVDDHPLPTAPGIQTLTRIARPGVRQSVSCALLMWGTTALLMQRPDLGVAAFRSFASVAPLAALQMLLLLVFEAAAGLAAAAVLICGPWFVYVAHVAQASDDLASESMEGDE